MSARCATAFRQKESPDNISIWLSIHRVVMLRVIFLCHTLQLLQLPISGKVCLSLSLSLTYCKHYIYQSISCKTYV